MSSGHVMADSAPDATQGARSAGAGEAPRRALRILHIGKYFPPHAGGMETFLRDLVGAQARAGQQPRALVHRSEPSLRARTEVFDAGGTTVPVTRAGVWFTALFTPVAPAFGWLAARLIRRHRPDVLHIHMPNVSAFWLLLLPAARRIPWVIHWQSDVLASSHSRGLRFFYSVYRPFERALLRRAARVISSSPPYLDSSDPLRPYRHKCAVVPLGIDLARLGALRDADCRPTAESPLRVLCVGRHTYYKGIDYLLQAVQQAAADTPLELRLLGSGEGTPALRDRAERLGIAAQVHFLGALDDAGLVRELQQCDCLVLPSIERTEAFGIVLLEAMQFGRAVIATAVPGSGMAWIVEDGVSGRVVPPADAGALAAVLREFAGARATMRALGAAGRERLRQQFSIDRVATELAHLYAGISHEPERHARADDTH